MNIDKIHISNFKNYYGEVSFDLSKQITILHGDNGFGKSSFFDAIEWCLTSKIGRFDGKDNEIKRDIINRHCELEKIQVYVTMEFGGNILTRYFDVVDEVMTKTQVKIVDNKGNSYRGTESVETFLKSEYFKDTDFQKGVYGKLIKQTYILSQDQVTDFVTSENSGDRYRSLANIMGLKSMLNETDNFRKILSVVKKENQRFEIKVQNYDASIKSKNEAKHVIDVYDMNSKISQIGVDTSQEDIENRCKELQTEMADKRQVNKSFLKIYSDLKLDEFETFNTIIEKVRLKEIKQKQQKVKIQKRKELLLVVLNRIDGLNKEKQNLQKYNLIRTSINESKSILLRLNIKENDFDEINEKLNLLRDRALKLEYQISIRQSININLETIKNIEEENKENQIKKVLMGRRKAKYGDLVESLESIIEKNKNKIMVQLITNIKEVQEYVKEKNLETCPVCSSTPKEKLESSIEQNVIFLNNKLQEDTKYLERSMKLIKKLKNKIEYFDTEVNKMTSNLEANKLTYHRLDEEINNYRTNKLYDQEYEKTTDEILKNELNNTRGEIKVLQEGTSILLNLKEQYEKIKDIENVSVQKMQKDFRPREESEINILIARLTIVEERIENHISYSQLNMEEIKKELKGLERIILICNEFISLEEYSKNLNEIYLQTEKNLKELENKISVLSDVGEMFVAIKMNSNIEQQIKSTTEERSSWFGKSHELKKVIEALGEHVQERSDELGSEAKDFLNRDSSTIQKYFRYLNPLPSNSKLLFDGEGEELNIKVVFDQGDPKNELIRNAKNILSSGQLNVLAISIFLAINEDQKTNSLDFVAIDDPIQNMDDVNQYSICDVLGSIKKQLIFSTHDVEFLKLFIKKNEHRKEDIQVYSFMSPYLDKDKVNHIDFT